MFTFHLAGRVLAYPFIVADINGPWPPYAGIYAFTTQGLIGTVFPIVRYIGQTDNYATRPMPPLHERWDEAVGKYFANTILIMPTTCSKETRDAIERDLINFHQPPMNVHHKAGTRGIADAGALSSLIRKF